VPPGVGDASPPPYTRKPCRRRAPRGPTRNACPRQCHHRPDAQPNPGLPRDPARRARVRPSKARGNRRSSRSISAPCSVRPRTPATTPTFSSTTAATSSCTCSWLAYLRKLRLLISRDEQRTDTVPARRTLISLTKSAVRMKSRQGYREYPLGRYRCARGRGACHVSSYNSRTVPASCDASLFPKTCPPRPGGVALVPRRDRHAASCRGITCGAGAMSADVRRRGNCN